MITIDHYVGAVAGFILGCLAIIVTLYNRLKNSITPAEAQVIYEQAKAALDEYNKAKADGTITDQEKLKIAENVLRVIETVIQDLENNAGS